jgi:formylglycine-generating enzyme required for sulfatase activity
MGLYDMNGNAWEWTLDWSNSTANSDGAAYNSTAANWNKGGSSGDGTTADNPFIDPVYNTAGTTRPLRGGSWGSDATRFPLGFRYGNIAPADLNRNFSFRVAVAATLAMQQAFTRKIERKYEWQCVGMDFRLV